MVINQHDKTPAPEPTPLTDAPRPERLLELRSGGWVLVLTGLIVVAIIIWQLTIILPTLGQPVIGDGATVASYGFDLSNCTVPLETIAAAGFPKDGLPHATGYKFLTPEQIPAENAARRGEHQHAGKAVVDGELVVGVTLGGVARAYPLRILAPHEIFPDELADTPLLMTYSPLCESVVVFDRRLDGEVLDFGASGLLYNSNLVMFDRRDAPADESLWSQLRGAAISGPAAGRRLTRVVSTVLPWGAWRALHPESTVLVPSVKDFKRYKRTSYALYHTLGEIQFPVAPRPPADGPAAFTSVLAVQVDDGWAVFDTEHLIRTAGAATARDLRWHGQPLHFAWSEHPHAVWLAASERTGAPLTTPCYWFAWYAMHPEAVLIATPEP